MMTASRTGRVLLAALLFCLLPCGEHVAQSYQKSSSSSPYLEAMPFVAPQRTVPDLAFKLLLDVPLPGPLPPGSGPMLAGGRIEIDVAGGRMASGWSEDAIPRIISAAADLPETAAEWSIAPDGRFRCSMLPSGHILGQKRCSNCRQGWRKQWKLRVAGDGLPPPLVTENRVYYGAFDNRVYSVKRKNGHRVWETDLPSRISKPLGRWVNVIGAEPAELDLVILIPDSGTAIIALHAETGSRVATYELPQNGGLLKGAPVVTADGKIVVARQKYAAGEASLLVFELLAPEPGKISAALPGSDRR
jgi:hypothetical protein